MGSGQLVAGEQLIQADGSEATVVSAIAESDAQGVTVYNFEVANDHTYFVDENGEAVWVHNSCPVYYGADGLPIPGWGVVSHVEVFRNLAATKFRQFMRGGGVYLLRDANTFEILKVGKADSFKKWRRPMKIYKIRSTMSDFFTGRSSDGRQMLFGILYPNVDALFFDDKGIFLERKKFPVLESLPANPATMWTPEFKRAASKGIEQFKVDFSLTIQPIAVQRFVVKDIWIQDRPDSYVDFLENPEAFEPVAAGREGVRREIEKWDADGNFVLIWGKDYWLNAEGKVIAT